MFLRSVVTLAFVGTLSSATMLAQQDEPNVVYKQKTVINMTEPAEIGGTRVAPEVAVTTARRPSRFPVRLPLRTSFRVELLSSVSGL